MEAALIDPCYGEHDLAAELAALAAAGLLVPPLDVEAADLPDGPLVVGETDYYDTGDVAMSRVEALEWEEFAAVDHDEAERFLLEDRAPAWMTLPPGGDLAAALDSLRVQTESPIALIEAMKAAARLVAWGESIKVAALASFYRQRRAQAADIPRPVIDERGRPADPLRSAAAEIAAALRLSPSTVDAHIDTALRLTSSLSATYSALRCGAIGLSKALTIAEATSHLPEEAQRAVEATVLQRAPQQTQAALKAALRRAVAKVDARKDTERHKDAVDERQCRMVPLPNGMAGLWITHSADKIRILYAALQAMAKTAKKPAPDTTTGQTTGDTNTAGNSRADNTTDTHNNTPTGDTTGRTDTDTDTDIDTGIGTAAQTPAGPGTEDGKGADTSTSTGAGADPGADPGAEAGAETHIDTRTAEQRRADVAVDVFAHILTNGLDWLGRRLPDQHRRRPHIEVLMPITTLLGIDDDPCELTGYGPIPADLARAIAADGTWRRILTDPATGTVLEASTTRHDPGKQVSETLLAKYPACNWTGCNHPARDSDRDHGHKYKNTGHTRLRDLRPYCEYHHVIKDTLEWGWTTTNHPDGSTTFTAPTGHTYTTHAPSLGPIAPEHQAADALLDDDGLGRGQHDEHSGSASRGTSTASDDDGSGLGTGSRHLHGNAASDSSAPPPF